MAQRRSRRQRLARTLLPTAETVASPKPGVNFAAKGRAKNQRRRLLTEALENRQLLSATPLDAPDREELRAGLAALETHVDRVDVAPPIRRDLAMLGQSFNEGMDLSAQLNRLVIPIRDLLETEVSTDEVQAAIEDAWLTDDDPATRHSLTPVVLEETASEFSFETTLFATRSVSYEVDLGDSGEQQGFSIRDEAARQADFGFTFDFRFGLDTAGEFYAEIETLDVSVSDTAAIVATGTVTDASAIDQPIEMTLRINDSTSVSFQLPANTPGNRTPIAERINEAIAQPLADAGYADAIIADTVEDKLRLRSDSPSVNRIELIGNDDLLILGFNSGQIGESSWTPTIDQGLVGLETTGGGVATHAMLTAFADPGQDGRFSIEELSDPEFQPTLATQSNGGAAFTLDVVPEASEIPTSPTPTLQGKSRSLFHDAEWTISKESFGDIDSFRERSIETLRSGFETVTDFGRRLDQAPEWSTPLPSLDQSLADVVSSEQTLREKVLRTLDDLFLNDPVADWADVFHALEMVDGVQIDVLVEDESLVAFDLIVTETRTSDTALQLGESLDDVGLVASEDLLPTVPLTVTTRWPLSIEIQRDAEADPQDAFSVVVGPVEHGAGIDSPNLEFDARLGFVDVRAAGLADFAAGIETTVGTGSRLTAAQLSEASVQDTISTTQSGSFDIRFDVEATIGGETFSGQIGLDGSSHFGEATEMIAIDLDALTPFANVSADEVAGGLSQIAEWFGDFSMEKLDQAFPLAESTKILEVVDYAAAFEAAIVDALKNEEGQLQFASLAELETLSDRISSAAYDDATRELTLVLNFDQTDLPALIAGLNFDLEVGDFAGLRADASLTLLPTILGEVRLGLDLRDDENLEIADRLFVEEINGQPIASGQVAIDNQLFAATANLGFTEVTIDGGRFLPSVFNAAASLPRPRMTLAELFEGLTSAAVAGVDAVEATLDGLIQFEMPARAQLLDGDGQANEYDADLVATLNEFGGDLVASVDGSIDAILDQVSRLDADDVLQGVIDGVTELLNFENLSLPFLDIELPDAAGLKDLLARVSGAVDSIGNASLDVIRDAFNRMAATSEGDSQAFDFPELDVTLPGLFGFYRDAFDLSSGLGPNDTFSLSSLEALFLEHFDFEIELPGDVDSEVTSDGFRGFVDEVLGIAKRLQLDGPGSLQRLEQVLENAIGLSADGVTISIETGVGGAVELRVDLLLDQVIQAEYPLDVDLSDLGIEGVGDLLDVGGSANVSLMAGAAARVSLGLEIPSDEGESIKPFLFTDAAGTQLSLTAGAIASDIDFEASLGPLGVEIVDGIAAINRTGGIGDTDPAIFAVSLSDPNSDGRFEFSETAEFEIVAQGGAFASLPIEFPVGDPFVVQMSVNESDLARGNITDSNFADLGPYIEDRISDLGNIGDNLLALVGGWEGAFELLIDVMRGDVLGVPLPLIGDALADEADFLEDIKDSVLDNIEDVAEQGVSLVQTGIFDALGPGGLNWLLDSTGDMLVTRDDVVAAIDSESNRVDFDIKLGKPRQAIELPVDFDLGLPGLNFELDAPVDLEFGFAFDLGFGVGVNEGFFLDVQDTGILVDFVAAVEDLNASGELAFLNVDATSGIDQQTGLPETRFTGQFEVGLVDPNSDNRLTLSEMLGTSPSELIETTFSAAADMNLQVVASIEGSDYLPRLRTDLVVDWDFIAGQEVNLPSVTFENVQINLGDFFSGFAGDVLNAVQDVLDPIQPMIDILSARLPVISDLSGSTTTIIDLARTFGRADVADFLDSIVEINDLITGLPTDLGSDTWVDLGQFSVNADALGGFTGPGWSASDTQSEVRTTDVFEESDPLGEAANKSGQRGSRWTNNLTNARGSLSFPLLQNPTTAFQLLLGKDVDLFLYDAPALGIDFAYRQSFPTPIPALFAELGGRIAAVADFAFGFDTSGIRQFSETGNVVDVFNGFFVSDRAGADGTGADVPEAYLRGSLSAGGKLSVLLAEAGVRGGIFADVDFNLHDNDRDGRVRFGELASNAALGPVHIFDVDGKLDAGLSAFYRFLFIEDEFEIARVNLLDFELARPVSSSASPTEILTSRAGDVLTINFTQQNDNYRILPGSKPGAIVVQGRGMITQDIVGVSSIVGNALGGNDTFTVSADVLIPIEIDGGAGDDQLTAGSGSVRFFGGGGNDSLTGGNDNDLLDGGAGDDELFGRSGADELLGGEGDDYLEGNDDSDLLSGGDGDDQLFGDAGSDEIDGGAGDDVIEGGRDSDIISGGDGDDRIEGGRGNDEISGGSGDDTIDGEEGADVINGDAGNDTITGGQRNDTLRGGDGNDKIDGGTGNDSIHGDGGDDELRGDAGADTLDGDGGDDLIFADSDELGDDGGFAHSLFGGEGNDRIFGSRGADNIDAGEGNDEVRALGGDDVVVGGLGNDKLFGDEGRDLIWGGLAALSQTQFDTSDVDAFEMPPEFETSTNRMSEALAELNAWNGTTWSLAAGVVLPKITPVGVAGQSISGQAEDGKDELRGGDGDDWLFGGSQVDVMFGGLGDDYLDGGSGSETTLFGGEGNDVIRGGSGDDVIRGGLGIDQLYGDAGRDVLYGDAGDSSGTTIGQRLHGGEGVDTLYAWAVGDVSDVGAYGEGLFGGSEGDFLYGNLRGELIFGEDGSDMLVGDWAAGSDYARNSNAAIVGGNDAIFGDAGQDQAYGGGGNDVLGGGGDGDWLEGQDGRDRSFGGSGIDFLIADVSEDYTERGLDAFDGHGDASDEDNATDVLWIGGTTSHDFIRITGGPDGQLNLNYNGENIQLDWVRDGEYLVEQIRIDGLTGNDEITVDHEMDLSALTNRSRDFVTILEGGPGDDRISGSSARDRIDGGRGSDTIWGNAGDDRLWGDQGSDDGSILDHDVIYAGGGSDDVLGGQGTNTLYAWSSDPGIPDEDDETPFGVFVEIDGEMRLEDTGLNRIIGGPGDDALFGGTGLDLLFGGDGENTLYNRDGKTFVSLDGGSGDDAWKDYARSTGQVWYVGGSNVDDRINVDFVTEPGILQGHHLITRLTKTTSDNGEEFFTFDAQVRLDFAATDDDGNLVWDPDRLFADGGSLASDDPFERAEALNERFSDAASLSQILPPEDDFRAIIIDALDGDDEIIVGPTVQKTVWVDAGDGDDLVQFASGRPILIDQTDSLQDRNDSASAAYELPGPAVIVGQSVDPADYVLENDAEFYLVVDDLSDHVAVRLRAADTDGTAPGSEANESLEDLIEDLNRAIEGSAAGRRIVARRVGDSIALSGTRITDASQLSINADVEDPAVTQLKLPALASSQPIARLRQGVRYTGLTIDNPSDVDFYRFSVPESADFTIDVKSLAVSDQIVAELTEEATEDGFTTYLVEVSTASVPTIYELSVYLDGAEPVLVVDLSDDFEFARRDVIFGGDGNDVLQGGPGEDFIFGGLGNDVLTGGDDAGASDLLFGDDGDDLLQTVPGRLPVLLGTSQTIIPTTSDRFDGGEGIDSVILLGGDLDAQQRPVNDFFAIRFNRLLQRYEIGARVWDTANQEFAFDPSDPLGLRRLQHYHFYTTVGVERTEVDLGAGEDTFRADTFVDELGQSWGIVEGDRQAGGALTRMIVRGGPGNDRLLGGAYDDVLFGDQGNDFIAGGLGNDQVEGGDGNDALAGETAIEPDGFELVSRSFGNDNNDTSLYAADLPPVFAGDVIQASFHEGDREDWYILRPQAEHRFAGQPLADIDASMIQVFELEQDGNGNWIRTGAQIAKKLFPTLRLGTADEPLFEPQSYAPGSPEALLLLIENRAPDGVALRYTPRRYEIVFADESSDVLSVDVSRAIRTESNHTPGENGFARNAADLGEAASGKAVVIPVGDFDGDGYEDYILSLREVVQDDEQVFGPQFFAYLYYGNGEFFDPSQVDLSSNDYTKIELSDGIIDAHDGNTASIETSGDFDGDGSDDILISIENMEGAGWFTILFGGTDRPERLNSNDADEPRAVRIGRFDDPERFARQVSANSAGDINQDSVDDIVVVDGVNTYVFVGRSRTDWTASSIGKADADALIPFAGLRATGLGDFDGDGHDDLGLLNDLQFQVVFGNGDGSLASFDSVTTTGSFSRADLVSSGPLFTLGNASVLISGQPIRSGNSTFGIENSYLIDSRGRSAPALQFTEETRLRSVGDLTGDGLDELVSVAGQVVDLDGDFVDSSGNPQSQPIRRWVTHLYVSNDVADRTARLTMTSGGPREFGEVASQPHARFAFSEAPFAISDRFPPGTFAPIVAAAEDLGRLGDNDESDGRVDFLMATPERTSFSFLYGGDWLNNDRDLSQPEREPVRFAPNRLASPVLSRDEELGVDLFSGRVEPLSNAISIEGTIPGDQIQSARPVGDLNGDEHEDFMLVANDFTYFVYGPFEQSGTFQANEVSVIGIGNRFGERGMAFTRGGQVALGTGDLVKALDVPQAVGEIGTDRVDDLAVLIEFCDEDDCGRYDIWFIHGGEDFQQNLTNDAVVRASFDTFRGSLDGRFLPGELELSLVDWDRAGGSEFMVTKETNSTGTLAWIRSFDSGSMETVLQVDRGNLAAPSGFTLNPNATYTTRVVGDLNGDGLPDLAVSSSNLYLTAAQGSDNVPNRGATFIVLGGRSGTVALTDADYVIEGAELGSDVVALGDLNEDGFDDFGITRALEGSQQLAGAAEIFFGGAWVNSASTPVEPTLRIARPQAANLPDFLAYLGEINLASGDLDGDGKADLVVGHPLYTTVFVGLRDALQANFEHHASIFYDISSRAGTGTETLVINEADTLLRGDTLTEYAGTLTSGELFDANGDGIDDAWIGAPLHRGVLANAGDTAGRVHFLAGQVRPGALPSDDQFEVLANRGSQLVDPQTGQPIEFGPYALESGQTETWFRFTTAGDGAVGDSIRVEAETTFDPATFNADRLPQPAAHIDVYSNSGQLLAENQTIVDLRNFTAGEYWIRVRDLLDRVDDDSLSFSLEIDPPTLGFSHRPSDRDRINGGDGDDRLTGGAELDVLRGGNGSDLFLAQQEEWADFENGTDRNDSAFFRPEEGNHLRLGQPSDATVEIESNFDVQLWQPIAVALGHPVTMGTSGAVILHRPWFESELAQIERLDLSGSPISDLSGLALLPNLRDLDLSNSGQTTIALPELQQLRHLILSDNPISEIDPEALSKLPRLESLSLDRTLITNLGPLLGVSVIDDGGVAGSFQRTGDWSIQESDLEQGFGDTYLVSKNGGDAFYFFDATPGEAVEVWVTWPEGLVQEETAAEYRVFNAEGGPVSVVLDQSFPPGELRPDSEFAGRNWQLLGTFVPTDTQLIVTVEAPSGQTVLTDAVYTRKVDAPTWPLKHLSLTGTPLDATSRDHLIRDLRIANPELETVVDTPNDATPTVVQIPDQTVGPDSLSFDDSVATLPPSVLNGQSSYLVEFWYQSENWDGRPEALLSAGGSTAAIQDELLIYLWSPNLIRIQNHNVNVPFFTGPSLNLVDGEWHHIVVVRDATVSNPTIRVYVDGNLLGVEQITRATPLEVSHLVIGHDMDNPGGGYSSFEATQGRIDEVVFWNQYWDIAADDIDQQILSKLSRERGPQPIQPEMRGMFSFEEIAGDQLVDSTGNHPAGMLGDFDGSGDDVRPAPSRVGTRTIELALEDGQLIDGRWFDADGHPVSFTAVPEDPSFTPIVSGNQLFLEYDPTRNASTSVIVTADDGLGRESRTIFDWNNQVANERFLSGQVAIDPFLSGTVVRDANGDPVGGAPVVLRDIFGQVVGCSVTGLDGSFHVEGLGSDVHTLEIQLPGDHETTQSSWTLADGYDFEHDFNSSTLPDLDGNGINDLNLSSGIVIDNGVMTLGPNDFVGNNSDTETLWTRLAPTRETGWAVELRAKVIDDESVEGSRGSAILAVSPEGSTENALLHIARNDVKWANASILNTDPISGEPIPVDNTDDFHDFRVVQVPGSVAFYVWRDGILLNDGEPLGNGVNFQTKARFVFGAREFGGASGTIEVDRLRINRGLPFVRPETVQNRDLTVVRNLDVGSNRVAEQKSLQTFVATTDRSLINHEWVISDDSGEVARLSGATIEFTPEQPGIYVIRATAEDADSAAVYEDSLRMNVIAQQRVPIIEVAPPSGTAGIFFEGTTIDLTADRSRFSDPSAWSTLTWLAIDEAGVIIASQTVDNGDVTWEFTPEDEGDYELRLIISDGNESIAAEPVLIRVENVVPSVLSSVESSFDRDVITVSGTVLDPGKDVSLVDVDFGDGVKRPAIVRDDKTFSLEHRYEDTGTYDVIITVDDLDGGLGQASSQLRIDTEAPSDLILSSDLRENIDTSNGNVLVGQIDVLDATPIDDHTLELVAGIGDSDDFELIGDELHLKQGVNVDYETKPSYTIRVLATDLAGNSVERDLAISVVNLPEVSGFTVNDGSAQRSRIRGLRIQFDQIVEVDDDAFGLIGPDNSPVPVVVERVHENLMTTVWLTLPASRLLDGDYSLVVKGDRIVVDNEAMTDDFVDGFFQKFGDDNGDGSVDSSDLVAFRSTFRRSHGDEGFQSHFDWDDDGSIGVQDFVQFRRTYGT